MRRENSKWCVLLFVALSFVGLTLGCGGNKEPNIVGPTTSSPAAPGQSQALSSQTPVATGAAAPARGAESVETKTRATALNEPVSKDSATPATQAVAKQKSANGGDQPADRADKTPDSAREPRTPQPEPATAKLAVEVIDLRKIPRLNETKVMDGSATRLWYMSRSSVAGAAAYHRTELTAAGWKEVPKQTEEPASSEYADVLFTKDGFYLRLSIGATGDEGIVSIHVTNTGNVDARRLPQFADAHEIPVDPINANYRTAADMVTVVAFCRKELATIGWQEYAGFEPDPTEVPHHKSLRFKKNAVRLDISVSDLSATPIPQSPDAKTHLAYMLTGMLDYDLPVRADAINLKLDTYPWRVQFDSPAAVPEVVEFYRSAYPKLGWKELEDESATGEESASLVFGGPDDVHFMLYIGPGKDDPEKTVVAFAQVAAKNDRPPKKPASTVADSKPAERAKPVTESEPPTVPADANPQKPTGSKSLGDTLAVPDGAKGVSRNADLGMLMFNSGDDAKKIVEFYRKALSGMGWREVKLASVVQNEFASLTFEKGDDTLSIAVLDAKPDSRTRTIIQGDALWPSAEPAPDSPPAKPAKPHPSEPTRTAEAKPTKEHQKLPNRGTITTGNKTYKLENVVAYHTKYASEDVTAIILTEKPVSASKLKASLKKNPPSDDFVSFEPHVKLIIDKSDQLIYYFIYADGLSINRGGTPDPEEISAESTVADGHASGKVAMKKPGEFFDKTYRFEVTFYTPIQNATASATTEPEPAPGELVAEDEDGLPVPENKTNRMTGQSQFRQYLQATIPAEMKAVLEFYRRELAKRDWKENTAVAKVEPEQAKLSFTGPDGELSVQLERKGKEVLANLTVRYPAKAKAAGMLPAPNKARLVVGNGSDKDAVIVINKKEYKIAAGVGARDPKDALSLDLVPGKFSVTIKQRGAAGQTKELILGAAETWGVVVLGDGECFADQLY